MTCMPPEADESWRDDPRVVAFYERAERRPDVVAFHAMVTALAPPAPGWSVLEVGCGVGATAVALGRAVGELGTVIGLDPSPALVACAQAAAQGPVRFQVGTVEGLEFPEDEFDLVRLWARRPLADPDAAIQELVRVCRPGGRVVVVDADDASVSVDVADRELVSTTLGVARRERRERTGYELRGRLVRAGCQDAVASPYVYSMTSLADAAGFAPEFNRALPSAVSQAPDGVSEMWFDALERADRAGELLVSITAWAAAARKPAGPR
jgi:SAM-dependent methyltransferase